MPQRLPTAQSVLNRRSSRPRTAVDAPTTGPPGFFIGYFEPGGYADFTKLTTSTVVHATAPSPNPVGASQCPRVAGEARLYTPPP